MKRHLRDTILCIAAAAITVLAVWFYFNAVEQKKTVAQADLYELVAPRPEALLVINRPEIFSKTLLAKEAVYKTLAMHVPEVFLLIAKMEQAPSPLFISLHPQGAVLYARADSEEARRIATYVLKPYFNTYAPQLQRKDGVDFTYYPDTGNRFFGFYEQNGAFVASYSKKLLEETAKQQAESKHIADEAIGNFRKQSDKNAPLNILVSANPLNLYVQLNDTATWAIQDQWLAADVFVGEGNLCCYGSLPYRAELDSLYAPMADTLSRRLEKLFPPMLIGHDINHDGKRIYYVGCQNSTLNPSYE